MVFLKTSPVLDAELWPTSQLESFFDSHTWLNPLNALYERWVIQFNDIWGFFKFVIGTFPVGTFSAHELRSWILDLSFLNLCLPLNCIVGEMGVFIPESLLDYRDSILVKRNTFALRMELREKILLFYIFHACHHFLEFVLTWILLQF